MDIHQIDQINLDKLTRKYRLLDKLSANHLSKLGYYKAIEIQGGPEKSKLGERLEKKQRKSIEKIGSHLENMMSHKETVKFLESLEAILKTGEKNGILGDTDAMVEQAHRYCGKNDVNNKVLRENLVIFTELIAFGYRYKAEGGIPDKNNDSGKSGDRKKAEKRIKAVEKRGNDGFTGLLKDLVGF